MVRRIETLQFDPHWKGRLPVGSEKLCRPADLQGLVERFGVDAVPKVLLFSNRARAAISYRRLVRTLLRIARVPENLHVEQRGARRPGCEEQAQVEQ
jgi:hypothetical protein